MTSPEPDDLIATVDGCVAVLRPLLDRDWDVPAGGLDWTCRETLEHVCGLAYAPVLATRAAAFRPLALAVAPGAPLGDLLWTVEVMSRILAEVARAAPSSARAYHVAGTADPSGFVAMGMDELLVHAADIT
ncbi:MAG: acetyltransferase, partial [Acidimicrobiales bacterium]|nr:acetyltransferase [Acidimicrobiales bacterium]